jgi:leader peptidase (prepilin peptidase)/N-methyltransferase
LDAGVVAGAPDEPLDQETPAAALPSPLVSRPAPVALAASALGALAFASYPVGAGAVIAAFMAVVLVVLAAIDIDWRLIPNVIVLPATAIVLFARVIFFPGSALEYIVAPLVIATVFAVPSLINGSLMGMGDVKLALLLGAGLGWGAVGALVLAFLGVFPFALATVIRGGAAARKTTLPFAPFLAFGGVMILILPYLSGLGV